MCKLGNADGTKLQPGALKIATISGMSPLQEAASTTEAVDRKARETITQMSEAYGPIY